MIQLSSIAPGTRARLVAIVGHGGFRRRLLEMGLLPGTPVRLVRQAGIGDLIELEVRGCHLSLRRSEASELLVEAEGSGPEPAGRQDPDSDSVGRLATSGTGR